MILYSRLLNVLHKAGTATLDGAGYTYDNAGNRTAKTNYLNNVTEQYTYDPTYQLTQVTQGTTTTESYSYDAVGNRLSSLGMSPYAYNSSNELTSTPSATFTYDGNGNTATKVDSSGTTRYSWDFENRLSSVVLSGSGGAVTFKYDPFGRRVQKNSSSTTTNYLYDGDNSVVEVDPAGTLLATYAQSAGVDEPLAELRNGTAGYYGQDGLGSVTSIAGIAGTLLNSDIYDSFGNLVASTGTLGNPFQYTGRDYDPETGLRYYRARYYDPTAGRFLSEDPLGFDSSNNFYTYVDNDPTNLDDPLGLQAVPNPVSPPLGKLIPWPRPKPVGFCIRFPWVCGIIIPLIPMNGGDLGPTRCADEAGAPGCSGPYASQVLNYHYNKAIKDCPAGNCKPCDPPVGTISYRLDTSKGGTHRGVPTPHWHLYVMRQNPFNCQCWWSEIADNQGGFGGGAPPSGTVPIGPAAGGGIK